MILSKAIFPLVAASWPEQRLVNDVSDRLAFLYLEASPMCGITGIIQTGRFYTAADLKRMTDALAHRGPDGEGMWTGDGQNVLLGHRRLSIIDLSEWGAQPLEYMDRYVIVHNGEIYNHPELRKELENDGYSFLTKTDTEVLVAAYDRWKEDCLQRFDGMFAFAIWDKKEKEFFAARDRFGEKPFHYIHDNHSFIFSSEIKAFWPLNRGNQLNRRMLFNFLTIGYTDNPNQQDETFYDDVKKLPPATFLRIRPAGQFTIQVKKYWDLIVEDEIETLPDASVIDRFSELFTTSVRRRLRSDVPLGTSLSGGLDSSSIVATICQLQGLPNGLPTFSAIFPGFEKNEEKHIDEVAEQFSLQSFKTNITDAEIMGLFGKIILQQDEPFSNSSVLPQSRVFELAKQNNVKVLLDGQGADETIAGYHKYYKWYWQELFRKRKLVKSREVRKAAELGVTEKFGLKNVIGALFPDFASVLLEKQYLLHALKHEDLTRDFVHLQSKEAYYTTPPIFSLNGILYFNTCLHGLEELLRYADRNSMAHGREVRLPFLSHELVEFLFTLPSNFKIREGWTKWILRKAMEKQLPASTSWRRDKIGLEPPQLAWMQLPSMQEMTHEAKRKLVKEKILKPVVLEKKLEPTAAYEKNNYDWRYLVSAQFL